jgi:hypothetical protein
VTRGNDAAGVSTQSLFEDAAFQEAAFQDVILPKKKPRRSGAGVWIERVQRVRELAPTQQSRPPAGGSSRLQRIFIGRPCRGRRSNSTQGMHLIAAPRKAGTERPRPSSPAAEVTPPLGGASEDLEAGPCLNRQGRCAVPWPRPTTENPAGGSGVFLTRRPRGVGGDWGRPPTRLSIR